MTGFMLPRYEIAPLSKNTFSLEQKILVFTKLAFQFTTNGYPKFWTVQTLTMLAIFNFKKVKIADNF